jgi:hypothetical protein
MQRRLQGRGFNFIHGKGLTTVMDCHTCLPPAETTVMDALKNWGKGE